MFNQSMSIYVQKFSVIFVLRHYFPEFFISEDFSKNERCRRQSSFFLSRRLLIKISLLSPKTFTDIPFVLERYPENPILRHTKSILIQLCFSYFYHIFRESSCKSSHFFSVRTFSLLRCGLSLVVG